MTVSRFVRAMVAYLRQYRLAVALLTFGMLVDLAFENGLALSLKFLIDDAIVPRNSDSLVLIISALVAFGVVYGLTAIGRDYLYAQVGTDLLNDIRERMFRHVQELPLTVYERLRPGDITSRFSGDLSTVESAVVVALPAGALALLGLLVGAVLMFVLQWKLALVATAALPLGLLFPRLLGARTSRAAYAVKQRQSEIANVVNENVGAQHVVKAFGLQQAATRSFSMELARLRPLGTRASFLGWMMERTPNLSIVAVHIAVLWVGAVFAIHGQLSVGSLVAFNALFLNVSLSVYGITFAIPELVRGAASYRRIEELLEEPAEEPEPSDAVALGPLRRGITLRDVTVRYDREQPTLDHVCLEIARGESVSLVGPSGSGKSTLVRVILGLDSPETGEILFDGHNLPMITRQSLRAQMAVVFQDNFLFHASIAQNVRIARPDASDAEVQEACRHAEIHDFIVGLPDGYETQVGERGGRLSGGERQRIAIARALLCRPEVLVFDEATSALDPGTEAAVNRTLDALGAGRTTISATHRLAAAVNSDRIVVLAGGRIVEEGTHAELLARGGIYSRLWDKQSGISVSDAGDRARADSRALLPVPMLADLDEALLAEVAAALVTERFGPGEEICVEGEPGDRFYMIARGQVEVVHARAAGEVRVNELEDGDFFGEIALVRNQPRSATVRTLTPTILLSLQRESFSSLCERQEGLQEMLSAAAQERLERSRRLPA